MERKMQYYLMRKNTPLTLMEFSSTGSLIKYSKDFNCPELLPLSHKANPHEQLIKWWAERSIPITQGKIKRLLASKGYSYPQEYLIENLGLSLTDYYWIRPVNSNLTWEDVNLFTNNFTENILIYDQDHPQDDIPQYAPNSSLQGDIEKTWTIINGKRCMIKGNHSYLSSESINEVIATRIHELQGHTNRTKYELVKIQGKDYDFGCRCLAFTTEQSELVSAWSVYTSEKRKNNVSAYEHVISVAKMHGMNEDILRAELEYQIMTDYILSGYDRHLNNIAFLRDADSLEFTQVAPIFDSGGCLFANRELPKTANSLRNIKTNGFASSEDKLLKLVTNPNIIDLTKLPPVSYIKKMYKKDSKTTDDMINKICFAYEKKIDMCRDFQLGKENITKAFITGTKVPPPENNDPAGPKPPGE